MTTLIKEDENYKVFLDYFQGNPVRLFQDKRTGEIMINADDAIAAMGGGSLNEFLSSDAGLDTINELKAAHPDRPLFGENGFIRKL